MKVAIIFFNFGGGHKEAAVNVKNALEKQDPDAEVRLLDGLAIAPRLVGWFWGAVWNRVQSKNQGLWAIMYNWRFFSSGFWRYWQKSDGRCGGELNTRYLRIRRKIPSDY